MPTITVKTATASYPVVVEQNCLQQQKKDDRGIVGQLFTCISHHRSACIHLV